MYQRVLLVDDEPALLKSLAPFLEDAGHQVLIASDALMALQMVQTQRPDAIVCDLGLPAINGIELCHELRRNPEWQTIPFILLTGGVESPELRQQCGSGINGCLTKPFDVDRLLAVLRDEQ